MCTCFTPAGQPHRIWCAVNDLVPGYLDSADGLADARDQRKADAR